MLTIHYGRNRLVFPELVRLLSDAKEKEHIVVVPKQLTLLTERRLLSELHLNGSFAIQVLSAERFCGRIFDCAGMPKGERIDEIGRTMLIRKAIEASASELKEYARIYKGINFPHRVDQQIDIFRKAGLDHQNVMDLSEDEDISHQTRRRLRDIAVIQSRFEEMTAGRYIDDGDTFLLACDKAKSAEFLRNCGIWFYGYDMMPPPFQKLIAHIAALGTDAHLMMPIEYDEEAPDRECFASLHNQVKRLNVDLKKAGAKVCHSVIEDDVDAIPARPELRHLEMQLYSTTQNTLVPPKDMGVCAVQLRTINEECRYIAAQIRSYVRQYGWHWSDVMVMLGDQESYAPILRAAFEEYEIPISLNQSRPMLDHSIAEGLVNVLQIIDKGFPKMAVLFVLRSGLLDFTDDESDLIENYAIRHGLQGSKWLQPLCYGTEEERSAVEPLRKKLMEPIVQLKQQLTAAKSLVDQLSAIFDFLTVLGVYERIEKHMLQLQQWSMWEAAGDEGQIWNHLLQVLDTMCSLLGPQPLRLRELWQILRESFSVTVIRTLPQSEDAVYVQGMNSLIPQKVKALFVMGAVDAPHSNSNLLLSFAQHHHLSQIANVYLGPDESDLTRMNRYYLKSSIGMVTDRLCVSCPLSGADGAAQRPGLLFEQMQKLLPTLEVQGAVENAEAHKMLMLSALSGSIREAASGLSQIAEHSGAALTELQKSCIAALVNRSIQDISAARALLLLKQAATPAQVRRSIGKERAIRLYEKLDRLSITNLENYASCPFSFFLKNAIKPEEIEPFEFKAVNEGNFLHKCICDFVQANRANLGTMSPEEACASMAFIANAQLYALQTEHILGDRPSETALTRSLRDKACACAEAIIEHMVGSSFKNTDVEKEFGWERALDNVWIDENHRIRGKIDRIDTWGDYCRVIDYKRSKKAFKLSQVYEGLQLQLPIYLAAATGMKRDDSAGAFYFTCDDGIVDTQEESPIKVREERAKSYKMSGLMPESMELLAAHSPNYTDVFIKSSVKADQIQHGYVMRKALEHAANDIAQIEAGHCSMRPRGAKNASPCEYCPYTMACDFFGRKVEIPADEKDEEVLARLACEYAQTKDEGDDHGKI